MAREKLIKDTLLTLIALVTYGLTNFTFNIVIGRVYGSGFLGVVSTALSTALLFSYIISTSFPVATAKYISEYIGKNKKNDANYVLRASLKYAISILLIFTISALLFYKEISNFFNIPEDIFIISIPIIFLYGLYSILRMAYYGFRNVREYFKNEIIADSIFFIALALIAFFTWRYDIYIPYILMYSIFIILAIYYFWKIFTIKKYPIENTRKIRKNFFTYAGIAFVGTFSSMAMRNLSIMLSNHYISSEYVGYLSAALSISTIFFLFPNAIERTILPEFSYIFGKGKKEDMTYLLNESTEYLMIIITIINSLGIIFSHIIIYIFYSMTFSYSIIILQILLAIFWIRMVARPANSILSGTKYVHIPNTGSLIALLTSLFLWFILIPLYGIIGTLIGFFIGVLIDANIAFFFAWKYYNLKYSIVLKNYIWILSILFLFLIPISPIIQYGVSTLILIIFSMLNYEKIKKFVFKVYKSLRSIS